MTVKAKTLSVRDRFLRYVDTPASSDACWEWQGTLTIYGYGQICINGKSIRAHRLAFELFHNRRPTGVVMHSCDNKRCVNPQHLSDGTVLENTRQAIERGLFPMGERQGLAKLRDADVVEIKRRIKGGEKDPSIVADFKVSRECVQMIRHDRNWKHIPWPA